ncbi:MAG: phage holin family protein [Neisseriales bacterium]|nr:MAG: phage holin family protein [Neisseriales bacterium]
MVDGSSSGSRGSLRELLKALIALIFNRLNLAGIEYKAYTMGQLFGVVWLVLALLALQVAILALLLLIALITPPYLRITLFTLIILVFFGIFVGAILTFKRHLAQLSRPFSATLNEIKKDWSTFIHKR